MTMTAWKTIDDTVGNTPLVRLKRLPGETTNVVLCKLEGNNPAGSVKDRPALSMIRRAEERGTIKAGDTLIEPTSGNTGIALAMVAAMRGYRMVLIMPEHLSVERRQTMAAYGAEIVLTSKEGGMEAARDLADRMVAEGKGVMLDQFANPDNPRSHYEGTGPELWRETEGRITHFVSSMGTTGTIMGAGRYLKEKNPKIQIIGCQPTEGSQIPGIRKWPEAYLPKIYDKSRVDRLEYVSQADAEEMARQLARVEGIFGGISSGGAVHVALRISDEVSNAVIVAIVCDRGDRIVPGVFRLKVGRRTPDIAQVGMGVTIRILTEGRHEPSGSALGCWGAPALPASTWRCLTDRSPCCIPPQRSVPGPSWTERTRLRRAAPGSRSTSPPSSKAGCSSGTVPESAPRSSSTRTPS
jgi:cysteine synthase B